MLQDLLGSLLAVPVFAVVFYAPGYLVAYAIDLYGFRRMEFAVRSTWAIVCSFCMVPIAAYLAGRFAGLSAICWLLVAATLAALFVLFKHDGGLGPSKTDRIIFALLTSSWIAFVLSMLIDFQIGHRLYFSVVVADQSYRIAFTDAVVRSGIPPANPLYFSGAAAPMHYYYFWYVLCAAVVKLGHVSSRQAFIASTVWAGFGLLATVSLYTQHFFRWERRKRWIAAALLFVTGADLLPTLGNALFQPSVNGDIEWWSVDPIDAWPDSLLWVPHHVASILCCLLCFLLLWRTQERMDRSNRRWSIILSALAFASSFGLSVYVALGFAVIMMAWVVRLAVLRNPERFALWLRVAAAGLLGVALLMPFLFELMRGMTSIAGSHSKTAIPLFSLSVRPMIDSGLLTGLPMFAVWNRTHPVLLDQAIRLILLLPGLAMELGLYGVVLVLLIRCKRLRQQPNEARNTALYVTLCGFFLTMFVGSSVISNNDFGYRAVMLPQFFLLLLTADVIGDWWTPGAVPLIAETTGRRWLLYSLLCLGVAGTLYGAVLLRAWLPFESRSPKTGFAQLPEDASQVREAFTVLHTVAPSSAVIAFSSVDPALRHTEDVMRPDEFYQRLLVMNSDRQMLSAEWKCAVHFGGDPDACPVIRGAVSQMYASPAPSAESAKGFCNKFGIQYLALSHYDEDWASKTGWPADLPVVALQPGFEILRCGR